MSWLTNLFRRRAIYRDLSEELRQHLEEKTEELMASSHLSRKDAEQAARSAFGNATLIEERSREAWQWPRLETLGADTKFALRRLWKSPAFTAAAVLTLALGIGANTAIFTLMHALLLQSLPIAEPDRLVRIAINVNGPLGSAGDMPLNLSLIQAIQRHSRSFSGVFGWCSYDFVLKEETGLHVYPGAVVSGNAFQVLGISLAAGRLLSPADDQQGGGPDGWAAVISHRFWRQHYHADPSVVGSHVTLTGHSVTIVGVAPEAFEGVIVASHPDFYLPLEYEPVMRGKGSVLRMPGDLWLTAWARLKSGVSMSTASAGMPSLFRFAVDETLPAAVRHSPVIDRSTFVLRHGARGWSNLQPEYSRPLLLLQILVGVVLLVCCVNLAGLCLARASTREHEFAIRGALGAARSRLMQQPLVESLLLALAGGALAVLFAWAIDRYLLRFLAGRQAMDAIPVRPQAVTMLATGACAVLCALLFGLAPAWLASHVSLQPAMRRSSGRTSARSGAARWFFVPMQVALTLVLVVIAAMLSATVMRLRGAHLGFHTENVLFVPADIERLPQKGADLVHLYERMVSRLEEQPGVESVSVANSTPLTGGGQTGVFTPAGSQEANPSRAANLYWVNDIGPRYFASLQSKFLAGRDFLGADLDPHSCILNQSAAAKLFRRASALGQTVRRTNHNMSSGKTTTEDCQVVGIVEDAKYTALREPAPPTVYLQFGAGTGNLFSMDFVIRAKPLEAGAQAYRRVLQEMAPDTPEQTPVAFSAQFEDSIAKERLLSVLSGFFAALALLLSAIGLYGLLASYVTRRTTEIGVRMALGATRRKIFALVIGKAGALLLAGVLAGGCGAWFAARAITAFLFDVNPGNPAIFAFAIAILALSGLLAALLPASRAVSIEPMQALRNE
jgi:predicted permease